MSSIPLRARVWMLILVGATASALGVAATERPELDRHTLTVLIALVIMIVVIEQLQIRLTFATGTVGAAVGGTVALAAGIHLGPWLGGIAVLMAYCIDSILARRAAIKSLTNVCIFVLTTIASATVYQLLADTLHSPLANATNIMATVVASLIVIALNATLIGLIVGPIVGIPFLDMLRALQRDVALEAVAMPAIAGLIVILARENATAVLVMIFPLLAPQLAMRTLEEVRSGIRSAIEMLADTVEERDQETAFHASRVANYAQAIIEEMPHIPHRMTETIVAAARIHDLGKVGVRDLALHRPGPLTAEQRREMDRHTVIGGEIVKQIRGYELTSAIIRGHHERWDGNGYPDKLSGEQIPIGARIIAVADAFDAMTSDRVYRKAMSTDAALRELSLNSGTQFDPAVVAAFARALGRKPLHDSSVPVAARHEVHAS